MAKIYDSLTELVGRTPLVHLKGYEKLHGLKANIYAKVEYFNPIGSVKDRIVLKIIEEAEKAGTISPETTTLVECTSGNTGIAVSAFGAIKGYKVQIYIQDGVSKERTQIMKAFGASVTKIIDVSEVKKVLEETGNDFVAGTTRLKEILRQEKGIFFVDQLINPNNPRAHYETTGKEIWEDTDGKLDVVVSAAGTGGTLRGISDFVKEKNPGVKVIAVEPTPDDRILTGIHNFTEVPEDRIPANLKGKEGIFDEVLIAQPEGAFKAAREVAKSDGVLVGNSSGAALWGATKIAQRPEFEGKDIVVVFPDTGLRYLSTDLFSE